jgi:hypothetical protein
MDGGISREWENLVNRYKRVGGAKGVVAQGEVLEVSTENGMRGKKNRN